jgi:hypothetical protein
MGSVTDGSGDPRIGKRSQRGVQKVLAEEGIPKCIVSLMRFVQDLSEFGFAVQIIQKGVFFNIGIAEETGFNAHLQRT